MSPVWRTIDGHIPFEYFWQLYERLWAVLALEQLLTMRAVDLAQRSREGDADAVVAKERLLDLAIPPAAPAAPRQVDVIFPFRDPPTPEG